MDFYVNLSDDGEISSNVFTGENLKYILNVSELTSEILKEHNLHLIKDYEKPPNLLQTQHADSGVLVVENGTVRKQWNVRTFTQDELIDLWIRYPREQLLAMSDWTQLKDVKLSPEKQHAWDKFRQELRDMTNDVPELYSPSQIKWPERP